MDGIVLDGSIRDWVLLPIMAVMFMVTMFREHLAVVLASGTPSDDGDAKTLDEIGELQLLRRAQRFRENGAKISRRGFAMRKQYYVDEKHGALTELADDTATASMGSMMNPKNMFMMVRRNVEQVLLMAWVNYFFQGFVIVELPFALTQRFRQMTQRGIELATLDVRYVSALSWYFLCLFGLRGITSLVLGEPSLVSSVAHLGGALGSVSSASQGPSKVPMAKQFHIEKESIQMLNVEPYPPSSVDRLIGL
jgi:ER membrane protein complex subunit 3